MYEVSFRLTESCPKKKRTPTSANVTDVNFFGQLLYIEKMKVNGRPRSFRPARFSITMTLKGATSRLNGLKSLASIFQ